MFPNRCFKDDYFYSHYCTDLRTSHLLQTFQEMKEIIRNYSLDKLCLIRLAALGSFVFRPIEMLGLTRLIIKAVLRLLNAFLTRMT